MARDLNFITEDTIIQDLSRFMEISEFGTNQVSGKMNAPIDKNLSAIKEYLEAKGYFPFFDTRKGFHIVNWGFLPKASSKKSKSWLNLLLLVLTIFTTLLVGALNRGGNPFKRPTDLFLGVPFSFSLILILGSHELGHYLTAQRNGVSATLPYFLPIPHPLIGTMGAFIRIQSIIPNRKALVRVGFSGPLIGFLVALPITIIGLLLSEIKPVGETRGAIGLGNSLIFQLLSQLLFGKIPKGFDLFLHPMAFAGWLGFFVTAMNLIPLGQLDGGHIAYALFGRRRKFLSIIVIGILVALGFFLWQGWLFWAALITVLGLRHPPTQDEISPLSKTDKILAVCALLVFIITFIPVPFSLITE